MGYMNIASFNHSGTEVWHCVLNVLPIVIPGLPNVVILSKMLDSHRKSLVALPHTGHGKSEVVHTAKHHMWTVVKKHVVSHLNSLIQLQTFQGGLML